MQKHTNVGNSTKNSKTFKKFETTEYYDDLYYSNGTNFKYTKHEIFEEGSNEFNALENPNLGIF